VAFENTGNDTAHNIYVMDTLSDHLDMNTLEVVAASAAMDIYSYNDGVNNIVKFDFPAIMLPDSSHPDFCHGLFFFKIKTKTGLADGTHIPNRVGIYFDYNDVVMTNTVTNIKGCPPVVVNGVAVISGYAKSVLYPNPGSNEVIIKTERGAYSSYTLCNSVGQEIMHGVINGTATQMNVKALPPGVYYVTLRGEQGREVLRFVKE
jgi:hypothetical protein